MPKSIVSIVKGTNPEELVELALGHLGTPDSSINTNPTVVAAVIKAARKTNVIRTCG